MLLYLDIQVGDVAQLGERGVRKSMTHEILKPLI